MVFRDSHKSQTAAIQIMTKLKQKYRCDLKQNNLSTDPLYSNSGLKKGQQQASVTLRSVFPSSVHYTGRAWEAG